MQEAASGEQEHQEDCLHQFDWETKIKKGWEWEGVVCFMAFLEKAMNVKLQWSIVPYPRISPPLRGLANEVSFAGGETFCEKVMNAQLRWPLKALSIRLRR
jgi:hypothetical protein